MKTRNNENGRIIILILITIFTLSAFWFVALTSTGRELQWVGGSKSNAQQFYDAEAGLNLAMEKFHDFSGALSPDVTTAVVYNTIKDPTTSADPAAQRVVAEITLRPIQSDVTVAMAHDQPAQAHESIPPAGSKSGVNSTVTRRYSINAVAGNKVLQAGVYLVVPK